MSNARSHEHVLELTKLSDEIHISTFRERFDERRSTRLCNRSELVDEVILGHAAAPIDCSQVQGQGQVGKQNNMRP